MIFLSLCIFLFLRLIRTHAVRTLFFPSFSFSLYIWSVDCTVAPRRMSTSTLALYMPIELLTLSFALFLLQSELHHSTRGTREGEKEWWPFFASKSVSSSSLFAVSFSTGLLCSWIDKSRTLHSLILQNDVWFHTRQVSTRREEDKCLIEVNEMYTHYLSWVCPSGIAMAIISSSTSFAYSPGICGCHPCSLTRDTLFHSLSLSLLSWNHVEQWTVSNSHPVPLYECSWWRTNGVNCVTSAFSLSLSFISTRVKRTWIWLLRHTCIVTPADTRVKVKYLCCSHEHFRYRILFFLFPRHLRSLSKFHRSFCCSWLYRQLVSSPSLPFTCVLTILHCIPLACFTLFNNCNLSDNFLSLFLFFNSFFFLT